MQYLRRFLLLLNTADESRLHHKTKKQKDHKTNAKFSQLGKQSHNEHGLKKYGPAVATKGISYSECDSVVVLSYQCVGCLSSLQSNLQVWQGCIHLIHFLLAVIHVVVWRHDWQLVDVVLRKRKRYSHLRIFEHFTFLYIFFYFLFYYTSTQLISAPRSH